MPQCELSGDSIYLDYHSTTPCDPRVAKAVAECLRDNYGNPASAHGLGERANSVVEESRQVIADHIGALPGELIFTSGATESNNLAICGLAYGAREFGSERNQVLVSTIEHKSVLKPARKLTSDGFEVHEVPVKSSGIIDLAALERLVTDQTLLVSVQAANNELGTIEPLSEVTSIAKECGAYVHCDAAQALGRMRLNVEDWLGDLLSISAHKAYGPKGIGALYSKGGPAALPLAPIIVGGGQERGLRGGTVNTPAVVGFAEACRIINQNFEDEVKRLSKLRDELEVTLCQELECAEVVGTREQRLVSTLNVRFHGVEADALLARLSGVALSTGSACEAGAPEPSHVLTAIGLDREAAEQCIRLAVGRFTSAEDVRKAASLIIGEVSELHSASAA